MRLVRGSGGPAPSGLRLTVPLRSRRILAAALALGIAVLPGGSSAGGFRATEAIHPSARPAPAERAVAAPRFPDAAPRHHNPDDLDCTECHLAVGTSGIRARPAGLGAEASSSAATTGNPALLRVRDPLDLCLSCHDGRAGVPDVVGEDVNGLVDRSGGFFGPPDLPSRNGHALAHGMGTGHAGSDPCGGCHGSKGGARGVTCIDCHDPHGNHVARNLRWASDPGATPALGLFVDPAAHGMRRYESSSVSYGTLDSDALREISSMCVDCHHALSGARHAGPGGTGTCVRHPSYDSERGARSTIAGGRAGESTAPAHWERGIGSGFEGTTRVRTVVSGATGYRGGRAVRAGSNGVFCLSCHKAHGSSQPFGLAWEAGRGLTAVGCDQCHNVAAEPLPALAGSSSLR